MIRAKRLAVLMLGEGGDWLGQGKRSSLHQAYPCEKSKAVNATGLRGGTTLTCKILWLKLPKFAGQWAASSPRIFQVSGNSAGRGLGTELLKVELQMVVDGAERRAADGVGIGEGWQAREEDTMWAEGPPP